MAHVSGESLLGIKRWNKLMVAPASVPNRGFFDLCPRDIGPALPRVLHSNLETFDFVQHAAEKLHHYGHEPEVIVELLSGRKISSRSSFTGVSGDAICADMVSGGAAIYVNKHRASCLAGKTSGALEFENVWALDNNKKCQEEILVLGGGMQPTHLFGDILEFLPLSLRRDVGLDGGVELPAKLLKRKIAFATMLTKAWCVKCGKCCKAVSCDMHTGSPPCTDDTKAGLLMKDEGKHRKFFYCFIAMRRTLREKFVRIENVAEAGVEELQELLGDIYVIVRIVTSAPAYGYCQARTRQDVHLLLKIWVFRVLAEHHPGVEISELAVERLYDAPRCIRQLFHRKCKFAWGSLLSIASAAEIDAAKTWSRGRPAVLRRLSDRQTNRKCKDSFGDSPGSFLESITVQERTTLRDVWAKCPADAVDTKNVMSARIVKSMGANLPTMIKGMGLVFAPKPDPHGDIRFFVMSELFECHGYPITDAAQQQSGSVCQFSRGVIPPSGRTWQSQRMQLGNGWHIGAFAANLMFIVTKLPLGTIVQSVQSAPTRIDLDAFVKVVTCASVHVGEPVVGPMQGRREGNTARRNAISAFGLAAIDIDRLKRRRSE
jgi:hypothetical protein